MSPEKDDCASEPKGDLDDTWKKLISSNSRCAKKGEVHLENGALVETVVPA